MKFVIIYQVIFHYRTPFYNKVATDTEIKEKLIFYGKGIKGTKLVNNGKTDLPSKKLLTLKVPYSFNPLRQFSFFPFLFFRLIVSNPKVILVEGVSSILNLISTFFYAKIFRKKIILWSLGEVKGKKKTKGRNFFNNFIQMIEKNVDAIFAYSSIAEEYFLSRGVNKEKIFKGVNVIDTSNIIKLNSPKNRNLTGDFRLLFVGSIIPEKNLEILLDSFQKLSVKYENIYLDVVGSGSEYYQQLIIKYEKIKNVKFHGSIIEGKEVFFQNADVFILPGLGGLSISEAMAYGLPVICTTADGTEKDLINKNTGVYIEDMNVENLISEIENLYSNRKLTFDLGSNARDFISNEMSFEKYYDQFKKSLEFVMKKK